MACFKRCSKAGGILCNVNVLTVLCDLIGTLPEGDSFEIQQAVSHMAEAALLGVGDASTLYPESLDEMYASYGGSDIEFRVVL